MKRSGHTSFDGMGVAGTQFVVWAPDALQVSVIGTFNSWQVGANPMHSVRSSGLWECFISGISQFALYKYAIVSKYNDFRVDKADPYGFAAEIWPQTASKVWDLSRYTWADQEWMAHRRRAHDLSVAISIYEVHLGSWRRSPDQGNRWLTYREMAPLLADYVHHTTWALLTSSSCPSPSIHSTPPGAIRRSVITLRPAVLAPRTIKLMVGYMIAVDTESIIVGKPSRVSWIKRSNSARLV